MANKKKAELNSPEHRFVLVGTYKGNQLTKWRGWYNYPVEMGSEESAVAKATTDRRETDNNLATKNTKDMKHKDLLTPNGVHKDVSCVSDEQIRVLQKINELWLFKGTRDERRYKAKFVGIKTREELIRDFEYPVNDYSCADGADCVECGNSMRPACPKPHGTHYALFKTTPICHYKLDVPEDAEAVIVRVSDFAKRSPKIAKQLKAYLESRDRCAPDLAKRLPEIITKLRPEQLCVCETAVQLEFFSLLYPTSSISSPVASEKELNVISLFSGAMGLDNGIEKAGLHIRLCVEIQHAMAETIRANKPNVPLIEDDIRKYTGADLLEIAGLKNDGEVFLMCGGPPCQAFSTAGKRLGFDDDRGNVFLKYIDLIGEIRPKYFLLENVRGLLSASYTPPSKDKEYAKSGSFKGSALLYALERIREIGYSATFTLYDSANYGVPQRRERVIILGSREGYQIPLIPPTHSENGMNGLLKWQTFRNAVKGLKSCTALPIPSKRMKFFKMIGPGECWHDLPECMQREAMGKSYDLPGGKTGFYRRLAWDEPSPTLVTCPTMPATDLMHPIEDRALSIEEYARIQMFPDEWEFKGTISDIYKQIGNAVPVGMGYAAARHLLWFDSLPDSQKAQVQLVNPSAVYSRYKNTSFLYFNQLRDKLINSSDNKKESIHEQY